jgi:hydrogenase expression/formation protein HypC
MCLAIPMQVIEVHTSGLSVRCEARGIEREAGLLMMPGEEIAVGDYVMISLGQVMQKVSAEEAQIAWAHYDEIFAAEAGNNSRR